MSLAVHRLAPLRLAVEPDQAEGVRLGGGGGSMRQLNIEGGGGGIDATIEH